MIITEYNEFILEKEFNSILDNILMIFESDGKWLSDNTIVWDIKKSNSNKLEKFLSKLSKEKVREYFYKFLNKINRLPNLLKRKSLIMYSSAFLSIVPITYLLSNDVENNSNIENEIVELIEDNKEILADFVKVNIKSSFKKSQYIVKEVERGYSSDKKDRGNYVRTKSWRKFIGTNHGISAPILMDHLGRVPTVDDMKNLSYEDALEIYKKQYWNPQNLSQFNNQSISNLIYDGCVNQGIRAMKDIVRAAYIKNGIKIGSLENPFKEKWIKMANALDHEKLFNSIRNGREKRYKNSITFKTHGRGWLKRLSSITYNDINIDLDKLGI